MTITLNVRTVNVLAEFEGNNTLNIIILPLNVILGSVAQWSRNRLSVQMVQVRFSAKLVFVFVVYILFRFVFVFNHIFPFGLLVSLA